MDAVIIQPRSREAIAAIQAQGDDELWLCPACHKSLAPVDTLCIFCEGEEHDHQADRREQAALRHGG